jgi:hypothetical protein
MTRSLARVNVTLSLDDPSWIAMVRAPPEGAVGSPPTRLCRL